MKNYPRIVVDPNKMGGVPCIRDLRMPVATIIAMLAEGMLKEEILEENPELQMQDINEALHYASELMRSRELPFAV